LHESCTERTFGLALILLPQCGGTKNAGSETVLRPRPRATDIRVPNKERMERICQDGDRHTSAPRTVWLSLIAGLEF